MFSVFLDFLYIFFRFGWEILIQEYYIRRELLPNLREALRNTDGSFGTNDLKRMCYYARFVPAVSGAAYGILVNRGLTTKERRQMLMLSAAAPIFDDYFDDKKRLVHRLKQMIEQPFEYEPQDTKEIVFIQLLRKISTDVRDMTFFMDICRKVYDSQLEALKQENPETPEGELRKITMDKGGYSTLLFKTLMEYPSLSGDNEAIYHFGGMVQWVDDIFDVYDDTKDGIRTPASIATDIKVLREEFENGLKELYRLFIQLDLPLAQKLRFLDLQWFFFSRAFVCLEQLENLQNQHNHPFNPALFPRKALICDMEKWENIRKWLRYFYKWKEFIQSYN